MDHVGDDILLHLLQFLFNFPVISQKLPVLLVQNFEFNRLQVASRLGEQVWK